MALVDGGADRIESDLAHGEASRGSVGPGRVEGLVPLAGLLLVAAGSAVMLLLHVIPPTSAVDPVRRTLSEYALGDAKWAFDGSLLLISVGSALGFRALARRAPRPPMTAVVLGAVWTVSLVVLVAFTKTDWAVGPSTGGTIHRYASVAAFLSLPVALLFAARPVFPDRPGWQWAVRGCAVVSLLWFGSIVVGVANMAAGGPPWWRFVPLGLVERMVAFSAVVGLLVLVLGMVRTRRPIG